MSETATPQSDYDAWLEAQLELARYVAAHTTAPGMVDDRPRTMAEANALLLLLQYELPAYLITHLMNGQIEDFLHWVELVSYREDQGK